MIFIYLFLFPVYEGIDETRISIHPLNLDLQYSNRHIMQSLSIQEFETMKHASERYIDIILHPVPQ